MNSLMKMKKNQKGFTLMEMLIVVAIIAVLVAILIPTVSKSLNKSKEATDIANLRSAYAESQMEYLAAKDPVELEFKVPALNYPAKADVTNKTSGVDGAWLEGTADANGKGQETQRTVTLVANTNKEKQATAFYYAKEQKITYQITIGENGCFKEVAAIGTSTGSIKGAGAGK